MTKRMGGTAPMNTVALVGILPNQLAMPNSRNAPLTTNPTNSSIDSMRCGCPCHSDRSFAAGRMPPSCMAQSIAARIAVYTDSVINMPRIATPINDMVEKLEGFR